MLSHGCNLQQGCTNRHLGQNLAHGNTETVQKTFKVAICSHILKAVKCDYILIFLGSEKDPLHLYHKDNAHKECLCCERETELDRGRNVGGREVLALISGKE